MIEGLHFDIEFNEMKEHLLVKARYHDGRRVWYHRRIHDLKEGGVEAGNQVSGGDPIANLQSQAKKHEGRSEFFQFMADHLIEGETYRLSEGDLRTLEFVSRYF